MCRFILLTLFTIFLSTNSSGGVLVLEKSESSSVQGLHSPIHLTDFESHGGPIVFQRSVGGSLMDLGIPEDGSVVFACSIESGLAFDVTFEIEPCFKRSIETLTYMENLFRPV